MQTKFFLCTLLALVTLTSLSPTTAEARYRDDVAGWVPWWISDTDVEAVTSTIDELDIVYPFIYEVEGGGNVVLKADIDDGVWEDLLNEADDERVEIIPTVAWFDGEAIHAVLSDRRERQQLVRDIEEIVDENDFDGINIDFESKWAETIDYFSLFLEELKDEIGRDTLTCTVEARMRPEHVWRESQIPDVIEYSNDYAEMNRHCDWVELMTYDQGRADILINEERRGVPYSPVADIDWVESVLELALEDFDEDKVMLGIPTYGRAYDVTVAPDWYRDYTSVASVNHDRAVELAEDIYNVPIGRTEGGEAVITYFPEDSVYKIFNQLPTPAGTPNGYEAAAKALLVANITGLEIPVRLLTWGDAEAAEDKLELAEQYNLKGVAFFSFNNQEDPNIWRSF